MDDVFAPTGQPWRRLPARYGAARMVSAALVNLTLTACAAFIAMAWLGGSWPWAVTMTGVGWTALRVVRAARWVRAFGYAEREDDLLISEGLLFRRLTAIPYGRMQAVRVETGPIDRAWGLATVSLVTASLQSQANIPGLARDEAIRLRDRLIEVGEAKVSPL